MIDLSWGGYANGSVPASALTVIDAQGHALEHAAAANFLAMQAALLAAVGRTIHVAPGADSANRTLAQQIVDYDLYVNHHGNVAAYPGTSNHGWARAVDITGYEGNTRWVSPTTGNVYYVDIDVWNWLQAHAAEYGFHWATGDASGEGWHWESYTTPSAVAVADVSASLIPATGPHPEEQDMNIYRAVSASTDGRIGNGYIYVQDADGPLRAVDNSEGSVILAKEAKGLVFIADWNGDDIRSLITRVGILEYAAMPAGLKMANGTPLQGPGKLTGRIVYDNSTLPDYPKVTVA